MLVPFAIDAESFEPEPNWSETDCKCFHNNLLKVAQNYGIMIHDGEDYMNSSLEQAISKLPQAQRSLWQELMKKNRLLLLSAPEWKGIAKNDQKCLNTLMAAASCQNTVLLLDNTKAEVEFNLGKSELNRILESPSKLEVCRFSAVQDANFFEDTELLAKSPIRKQEGYKEIWESRFLMLAKAPIKCTHIVDRYALENHVSAKQGEISGLDRFLRLLNQDATGKRNITLYSAKPKEYHDRIKEDLGEILGRMGQKRKIKELKVVMLQGKEFRKIYHDRFIRFGNYVWSIGTGLAIFEKSKTEEIDIEFKTDFNGCYTEIEEKIKNHSAATQMIIPPQ